MPLYEYQCRKCGQVVEVIQKFSDRALTRCKECGGKLERLLSAPAIQFKGSGWYITDYAGKGGEGKADKGEASKSDAKPKSDKSLEAAEKSAKSSSGD